MQLGTKSLLIGIHQFILHPLFVARAWQILYGFPKSLPLWVSFFVHDLGYLGRPNMDGPEGKLHPELGGRIMTRLFGTEWGDFTICHSRYSARARGRNFSQLCVADKLASIIYPTWLYILLARLSGEMVEYRSGNGDHSAYWKLLNDHATTDREWFETLKSFTQDWINQNKDKGDPIPSRRISSIRQESDISAKSNQLESR